MPGRLVTMATNGAEGAKHAINGKQSPAGAVQPADATLISGLGKRNANDNAFTNGENHIPGLGAYPTPNGVSPSSPSKAMIPASIHDLPDEIMHITEDQHSLGALIQRVSAECFNRLETLIDELRTLPVQPAPPLTNGVGNPQQPPSLDPAQLRNNMKKKKLMLEFASDYRAKFIKLLVVSDWAKRDQRDVSKLIDLKVWLVEQDQAAQTAGNFFYNLISEWRSFKITNPDIETALAVLSNGDVPWIPHFNFREQEKLPAEEILKVMRRMNTIINLRLVLHEELIPQLRDYRIADGRATFTFPQEFELDVYVASEDPEQPWYFLDVRFLFEPAPQMTGDLLRGIVDSQINHRLAEHGLRGACELVHNFVLTHKINILLQQARALQRGIWASALGVELVRRILVVQYWLESPQSKSWIEIGIVSGKDKSRRKRTENAITSQIKARWIRNGKEQKEVQLSIDLTNLSIERVVSAYVARHSSYILEHVRDSLEANAANLGPGEEKILTVKLTTSTSEPSDCVLQAQIGQHPATTLQIDGITGRLYLSPAGPATPKAQEALERSKDPLTDAPAYLARYLTYEIQMRIDRLTDNIGWESMRHVKITPDEVRKRTKRDVHRFALFQPRGFKGTAWYIMYTINLCGECWWALEFDPSSTGDAKPACSRLQVQITSDQGATLSLAVLRRLEQSAVSAMSYILANRDLAANGVSTALRYVPVEAASIVSKSSSKDANESHMKSSPTPDSVERTLPTLMVRFSQLLKARSGRFANELLQLQYLSFDTNVGQVRLVAKGRMRNPTKVQDILQRTKDSDVAFAIDGSFSMVVATKLGTSCVNKVVARLKTLSTLCNFAKILKDRGFECREVSFSKVCFKYAEDQEVALVFGGTEKEPRIKLEIGPNNPHRRVAPLLEEILNDPELGFERFTMALEYFLPVLRAFQTLEKKHALDFPVAPTVHPRQVDFYRLTYPNRNAQRDAFVHFDLSFKRNKDDLEWRVSEVSTPAAKEERNKVFPGFNNALHQFMKRVGTGWTGMTTLLVANRGGIEDAILELDRCVWEAMQNPQEQASADNGIAKGPVGHEIITID